ncbi:MAG TPA: prolyl oligopeptidase family serine peptidase [Sporichthyaceae bacterium]|jgi:prolyl oligopeptidase|nr:prolyl oligopeptidase family serine peptidase [Sporichthyaceae bacterium]
MPPTYPPTARQDIVEELHGKRVADPYRWLEDAASTETTAWASAQGELFASQRDTWPGRDGLRARLSALLRAGVVSSPAWRGQRQFFMRRVADQEHAVLLTVEEDGTERVLLNPMAIDPTGRTTLDAWQPSKDGRLMAYQLSEGGTEESVLRVIDVVSGELLDGPIDRARYSPVAWIPGGKAYYYVRRLPAEAVPVGEGQYHRRIFLHQVGTHPDTDLMVFGEGLDKTNYYGVSVSRDGRWLTVTANTGTAPRNDVWIADLTDGTPDRPSLVVVQQGVDASTGIEVGRDARLYVFTDADSPRGRLCVTDPGRPTAEHWVDLIGEDPEAVLDGYAILDGAELRDQPVLLCAWTRHAVSELTRHDLRTGEKLGTVPLPGLGSIGGISERPEGGHEAWFGYTDHTTPSSVHHYDARTDTTTLWAQAPGQVEVPDVTTRQVSYTSRDGTTVRMFVIHRSDYDPAADGPRPTTLYGYGGFGISLTPAFSAGILAWVEAGGVYAVANLRGGGEEGESWHRDGMLGKKQNVFDDFHAGGEWLVAHGWTTPDRLSISGGSNGGLLVGAAMTQRPDLFAAVVCSAPLLDMVRYEQFGLGQTWNSEYGTAQDPEQLGWLLDYSPYHRVAEGVAYPALLLTVFDGDTRVDTMHARKFAAALQHATTSEAPILVRAEADVGHGARAVSRAVDVSVDALTFAAAHSGGLAF